MASSPIAHSSHRPLPTTSTCHPNDPIPEEPTNLTTYVPSDPQDEQSPALSNSSAASNYSVDSDVSSPATDTSVEDTDTDLEQGDSIDVTPKKRRVSTVLVSQNSEDLRKLLGPDKVCCGGGCCMLKSPDNLDTTHIQLPIQTPENQAFRSLSLKLRPIGLESDLSNLVDLPEKTISFSPLGTNTVCKASSQVYDSSSTI